jgi:hypothetical protein
MEAVPVSVSTAHLIVRYATAQLASLAIQAIS